MKVYGKKKETAATAKVKLAVRYSNRDMDWIVFILSFRTTLESKLTHFRKSHSVVTKTTDTN